MTGKEVIKSLKKHGWKKHTGGRHLVMKKNSIRVPIPMHGNKDIPIGTLKSIEKATGVKLS